MSSETPSLLAHRQVKMREGILFIVSAPSGAGKTSLCREIKSLTPGLYQSVSFTTRTMRAGERDGVDYHFVDRAKFDAMIANDVFAEWAEVHGNCYGTARAPLLRALADGMDILLDIDFQGAAQLREAGMDAVYIFILPPSMAELRARLEARNTDSDKVIEHRMRNAVDEISRAGDFDYLVVNDRFDQALEKLKAIMVAESVKAKRLRAHLPKEFNLK